MALVGSLIVLLGANTAPLTAGLLKAEGELKAYGATTNSTAAMASASIGGIGLIAVAGLGLAAMAAASFQEQMAKVNTIAHMGEEPLAALGAQVRELSVATGVGVGDLTSGLYDLFSVGVPAGQAMEFLTNATTLSIGGLSTANEAVNAITTAINSWSSATGAANLTMADSAKVTDIFAQAIAAGGMTAADIPQALANVASQAAMMNMPLEEIGAAWSILTVRGQSAAEASTSVAAALTALAKAPPGMEKLQKTTGKTYLEIAKTKGVHEALMQVVADAAKYGVVLEEVFGRKEALPFVTFTTGAGGDQLWGQALAAEFNSSGVAAGQMEERMGTLNAKLRIFGASVNDLAINVGTVLLPPLTDFVDKVSGVVKAASDWSAANPGLATTIAQVAGALLGLSLAMRVVSFLGAPVQLAMSALGVTSGTALTGGIATGIGLGTGAIVAALVAAVAAAVLIASAEGAFGKSPDTPAKLEEAHTMGHWGAGYNPPTPGGGGALVGPRGPATPFGGALVGPRGPASPTPIQITTTVMLDGQKVGESMQRQFAYMDSVHSSGHANDDHPRQ